jgi:hypothetical protein
MSSSLEERERGQRRLTDLSIDLGLSGSVGRGSASVVTEGLGRKDEETRSAQARLEIEKGV